ncbi:hypothetical protein D3C78_1682330 [compost metagenome]
MRFVVLAGALPDSRFFVCKGDDLANRYLGFVPLEDQHTVWTQHSESLGKSGAQFIAPCFTVKLPVLLALPAVGAYTL